MLKLVVLCDNDKNIKGYEDLINKSLLKTKFGYEIHKFNDNDKNFYNYIDLNQEDLIILVEESEKIKSINILNYIRGEKSDIRSFVTIIDFNHFIDEENLRKNYFVNNKILNNKDKFEDEFDLLMDLLIISYQRNNRCLEFTFDNCIYRIPFNNILYIEKERNTKQSKIICINETYEISKPLSEISSKLDDRFVKTHRSAIINIKNVKNIDFKENLIIFQNGTKCDLISRDNKNVLKQQCSKQEEIHTF